jgi:response regulator RpfG family c-di-GMP phosphodiesterase
MPLMPSFQFFVAYELLKIDNKTDAVVMMLTISTNPNDQEKSKSFTSIKEFLKKPFTPKLVV